MNDTISAAAALAPLVLAQVPSVSATELGQWLLVGAALAVIANQGMSFFKNLTGQFARKNPAPADSQTSVAECIQKHAALDGKHAALSAQIVQVTSDSEARSEKLRLEVKNDVKGIHQRIDSILAGVSRLEGKIK